METRFEFNKLWFNFISKLSRGKRFMNDLLAVTTKQFDQKENIINKIFTLKEMAMNDFIANKNVSRWGESLS